MNQHKIYRVMQLIDELYMAIPKRVDDISLKKSITKRSIYRYLELLEDLGFKVHRTSKGLYYLAPGKFNQTFLNYLKQKPNGNKREKNLSVKPKDNRTNARTKRKDLQS